MLECVLVILDVVTVVVGVSEEIILHGEDVSRAKVGTWQACTKGILYLEDLFLVI